MKSKSDVTTINEQKKWNYIEGMARYVKLITNRIPTIVYVWAKFVRLLPNDSIKNKVSTLVT